MKCMGKGNGEEEEEEDVMTEEERMEMTNGVPVDSGFGWVITMCVFFNMLTILGYNRSLSVLFVDFTEVFDQSSTIVSLMFTIGALSTCLSSLFTSNVIMTRYSVRRISMVASLCNALITGCVSMAPNIALVLVLAIFKGIVFGCLMVCPMSLIGFYFKKRRNLALSVANAGHCVAFIAFPPIADLLRSEFGLRGCLLIISALELHLVAINMLLRPPESFTKRYIAKKKLKENSIPASDPREVLLNPSSHSVLNDDSILSENSHFINSHDESVINHNTEIKDLLKDNSEAQNTNTARQDNEIISLTNHKLDSSDHYSQSSDIKVEVPDADIDSYNMLRETGVEKLKSFPNPLTIYKDPAFKGSQMSLCAQGDVPLFELPSLMTTIKKSGSGSIKNVCHGQSAGANIESNHGNSLTRVLDLSLFKNWLFRMMVLYCSISIALNFLIIFMPVIATRVGVPKKEAALYMTVSGVMDLVMRIFAGFIADYSLISKAKMVTMSLVALIVLCHTSRFFLTKDTFLAFALVVGVFGGFRQNTMAALTTDYVGVEKMAKGFSIGITFSTLFLSSNYPIIGAMLDSSDSFNLPLHFVGIWLIIAAVVIGCEPIFAYLEKRRIEKETLNQNN